MHRELRVAVVGAGPAGIYAADILAKSDIRVSIDVIDRDPTPFGLIRYGVAPDHPRIKEIIKALHRVMEQPEIRFLGNVDVGGAVPLEELRPFYDAVILATGARHDRTLDIPGIELEGSFGAADFVSWYDGHPEAPREWPFASAAHPHAGSVAVLGVGNVGLDVARILAKTADELLATEIPANVHAGLQENIATDVHVFARRGPAQVKFSPMELRELSHSPTIDVIVHPEGFDFDEASERLLRETKAQRLVVDVLTNYLAADPDGEGTGKPHRIHIHFCHNPVELLGEDGRVVGLRTEITELDGTGSARGTGEYVDWPLSAVYRAVGYYSDPMPGVPFDPHTGTIPHEKGRVDLPGLYVTGWIKRGPIGLIGHTKSDAAETIASLLDDAQSDTETLPFALHPDPAALDKHLADRGQQVTTWQGWTQLDAHEIALGQAAGRPRIKIVPRDEMVRVSRDGL